MSSRTSHRWAKAPGSLDTTGVTWRFKSDNPWGIPALKQTTITHPHYLTPWQARTRSQHPPRDGAAHFFLDDYRFESIWRAPLRTLAKIRTFQAALTPDFSLYLDAPRAVQIWNVYRNRWMGAFWISNGIPVIPTLTWGHHETYEFCFAGVPASAIVAINCQGIKNSPEWFQQGYRELINRLNPTHVLCYGRLPCHLHHLAPFTQYPTRWESIRAARKAALKA